MELLCCAVVMVIGQNPGEQVDDRRIALMAVEANMAARRYGCPAEPQFAVCDAVDLLGEIDRGEHVLGDRFIIDWRVARSTKPAEPSTIVRRIARILSPPIPAEPLMF
jgi:hypothetical protein